MGSNFDHFGHRHQRRTVDLTEGSQDPSDGGNDMIVDHGLPIYTTSSSRASQDSSNKTQGDHDVLTSELYDCNNGDLSAATNACSQRYRTRTPTSLAGWRLCVHPQGWIYFHDPERGITTDEDVRSEDVLEWVEENWRRLPKSDKAGTDGTVGAVREEDQEDIEVHLNSTSAGWQGQLGFNLGVNHRWCVASHVLEEVRDANVERMDSNELNRRRRLYWNHLWNHPSHCPTPERAVQDAADALTWFFTDNLLCGPRSVVPFSKEECADLSRVLQNLSTPGTPTSFPAKTVFLAWLLREVCSFRDAELYGLHTHKASQLLSSQRRSSHIQTACNNTGSQRTWMSACCVTFLRFMVNVLFFGIPWTYRTHVLNASEYHGRLENIKHSWNTYIERLVKEYSHFLLISTVLLSAAVGFLAIEDLSQPAVLASTISAFASLGSIIVGVFSMWRHQTNSIEDRNNVSPHYPSLMFQELYTDMILPILQIHIILTSTFSPLLHIPTSPTTPTRE